MKFLLVRRSQFQAVCEGNTFQYYLLRFYYHTFLLLTKNKISLMRSLCCVCVCMCISSNKFLTPDQIFMKLGMHIMAPEPISRKYFINPSHQ
jgi:hypothetical protein